MEVTSVLAISATIPIAVFIALVVKNYCHFLQPCKVIFFKIHTVLFKSSDNSIEITKLLFLKVT